MIVWFHSYFLFILLFTSFYYVFFTYFCQASFIIRLFLPDTHTNTDFFCLAFFLYQFYNSSKSLLIFLLVFAISLSSISDMLSSSQNNTTKYHDRNLCRLLPRFVSTKKLDLFLQAVVVGKFHVFKRMPFVNLPPSIALGDIHSYQDFDKDTNTIIIKGGENYIEDTGTGGLIYDQVEI